MRADNSHHLAAAAQRRSANTRDRATAAVQALHDAGEPITFDTVAAKAGVSRAWLYNNQELRSQISELRERNPRSRSTTGPVPGSQRASDASLLRRLELAQDRIQRLTAENAVLRRDLARALGQARTALQAPATSTATS